MGVDCARDAVGNFYVKLGDNVLCSRREQSSVPILLQLRRPLRTSVHARIADIAHGSTLDHVTDSEALDRLVLGHAS